MKLFYRQARLGRSSVKEGFDNLPSGICFADCNGSIILCNRQMHRLCHLLMGTDLQHIFELRQALKEPQSGVTVMDEATMIYHFPNNSLWQFSETAITDAEGNKYTQIQAISVTELYEKRAELERENQALIKANTRAKKLYAELEQIIREKETLAMKMKVHDDMGQCLLSTRDLLTHDSSLEDYRKGGRRWAQALRMLSFADHSSYAEGPAASSDPLAELLASAAEIGVRINVQGELPPAKDNAYLLIVAMRECATNTVRHAKGNEMTVQLIQTRNTDIAVITNNGTPPNGEIIEGGGLSSLRRSVENRGGAMIIDSKPVFRLAITLPKEEEQR